MNSDSLDKEYLKSLTLLYVEDDEDTREQCSQFLSFLAGTLFTAVDGADGLMAYSEHKPDIIITDIKMPNMTGLNMSSLIRSVDESVGVIITTAHSEKELLMKSIDISVDAYVTKPVLTSLLYEALIKCAHRLRLARQQC
jgi:YesN/AraC family two-component response regulator